MMLDVFEKGRDGELAKLKAERAMPE